MKSAFSVDQTVKAATVTPDVPLAISELKLTCAWMMASKAHGGLGYSLAQVKTTHAYHALVALGGTL